MRFGILLFGSEQSILGNEYDFIVHYIIYELWMTISLDNYLIRYSCAAMAAAHAGEWEEL